MLDRCRYLGCFLSGQFVSVPAFHYVGVAIHDEGGGPAAAGIVTGLGIGMLSAIWLNERRSEHT